MKVGLHQLMAEGSAAHVEASRAWNAAAQAADAAVRPDPSSPAGLEAARKSLSSRPPHPRAVTGTARAGGRQVPVRIVTPGEGRARAVCLHLHGGGFYMDAASRSDARNVALADAAGVAVVSVDYRLAPEHPWPAAPDDCETAARWLVEAGPETFGTTRLAIVGSSAGANLAVATLLRLRDRGQVGAFLGAVLEYGAYDLSGRSPGGRRYADEWFIQAYAGHVADRTNPDISPIFGELRGLPPALLVVGSLDILLEDSLAMAARLVAAGTEVDVRVYPESTHGFASSPTPMATAAAAGIVSWLSGRLSPGCGSEAAAGPGRAGPIHPGWFGRQRAVADRSV